MQRVVQEQSTGEDPEPMALLEPLDQAPVVQVTVGEAAEASLGTASRIMVV